MALMGPYVVLTVQYLILMSMNLIGTSVERNIQLLSKILVAMLFARALPVVVERSKARLIITYFVWAFTFLLHYLMFPENRMYQKELVFPLYFMCLPAFIYSSAVRDWEVLKEIMTKASYVVFSIGALLGLLIVFGRASIGAYSQSFSYYLLLPAVMSTNEFLDTVSLKSIVLALISFLLMLALGSRGAIMCICVFIMLSLLRRPKTLRHAQIIAYLLIVMAAIVIGLCFDELLMYMQGLLSKFGLRSRNISLFLRPDVYLSGRDSYYSEVIARIIDHPFAGLGIAGDRYILGGSYVHNIFIEILANYGVVIGMLVILGLLVLQLRFCFCGNEQQYEMFSVWVSIGFVPLLVSGSYLTEMTFWILLGLMTRELHIESKSPCRESQGQADLTKRGAT